ncbi:MAG: hypothetical protein JWQ40_2883 [Segetibacter sp.]|nr:hypothetical protein [Segetibacter sp.]
MLRVILFLYKRGACTDHFLYRKTRLNWNRTNKNVRQVLKVLYYQGAENKFAIQLKLFSHL